MYNDTIISKNVAIILLSKVRAVDFSRETLDELEVRAKQRGLEHLVETIECDMGSLDWKTDNIKTSPKT